VYITPLRLSKQHIEDHCTMALVHIALSLAPLSFGHYIAAAAADNNHPLLHPKIHPLIDQCLSTGSGITVTGGVATTLEFVTSSVLLGTNTTSTCFRRVVVLVIANISTRPF
jgi:hypothetical protein